MTYEERIEQMTIEELRAALAQLKAREAKRRSNHAAPKRELPRNASARARLLAGRERIDYQYDRAVPELKVNVAYAQPMSHEEVHARAHICMHTLHRARWIPGPFRVALTDTWMVPTVCEHCGAMIRKFIVVEGR